MMKPLLLAAAVATLTGCFTTVIKFPGKTPNGQAELDQYRMTFLSEKLVALNEHCNGGNIAQIKHEFSVKNQLLSFFTLGFMHREDVELLCAGKGGDGGGDEDDGGKKKPKKKKGKKG